MDSKQSSVRWKLNNRAPSKKYLKSYKYKHKLRLYNMIAESNSISAKNCDHHSNSKSNVHSRVSLERLNLGLGHRCNVPIDAKPTVVRLAALVMLLLIMSMESEAFCPSECECDDNSLAANCTQVPSISIIPMTLSPQLKRLTLNQVPIVELSNSLMVYRQLEYLNLDSNQLRRIRYQNFNFRPPQSAILLTGSHEPGPISGTANGSSTPIDKLALANWHQERAAQSLRQSIARGLGVGVTSGLEEKLAASSEEIGFHLREMSLANNQIEQLGGSLGEHEEDAAGEQASEGIAEEPGVQAGAWRRAGTQRLRPAQLERQSPFLTLGQLESLSLAGNKLRALHEHAFLGLLQLKRLDLARNQLELIDRHALVGLVALQWLRLSGNRLAHALQPLGHALCRAPMVALRWLDLSDNYAATPISGHSQASNHKSPSPLGATSMALGGSSISVLPNQMFVCASQLVGLRLDNLQLRYVQVNAFDNLHQLESLNLSRNFLEQVPSDSLRYSHSNLSSTLKQLDLSETLIEFVGFGAFGSLRNLQLLSMRRMPRLVSFDLASLAVQYKMAAGPQLGTTRHLAAVDVDVDVDVAGASSSQLANDQLRELHLDQNPRLVAIRSSLAARLEPPNGRIQFSMLRLLSCREASELRELPIDELIQLEGAAEPLAVDLTLTAKLNCSACQMSWLVEAARPPPAEGWPPAMEGPPPRRVRLIGGQQVGCSWPFAMPLVQLLDLDNSYAPILARPCRPPSIAVPATSDEGVALAPLPPPPIASAPATRGWPNETLVSPPPADGGSGPALVLLLVLVLASLVVVRLVAAFLARRSRLEASTREFKWLSASGCATSGSEVGTTSGSLSNSSPSSSSPRADSRVLCGVAHYDPERKLFVDRPMAGLARQPSEFVVYGVGEHQLLAGGQLVSGQEPSATNINMINNNVDRPHRGVPTKRRPIASGLSLVPKDGNLFSRFAWRLRGGLSSRRSPRGRLATSGPGMEPLDGWPISGLAAIQQAPTGQSAEARDFISEPLDCWTGQRPHQLDGGPMRQVPCRQSGPSSALAATTCRPAIYAPQPAACWPPEVGADRLAHVYVTLDRRPIRRPSGEPQKPNIYDNRPLCNKSFEWAAGAGPTLTEGQPSVHQSPPSEGDWRTATDSVGPLGAQDRKLSSTRSKRRRQRQLAAAMQAASMGQLDNGSGQHPPEVIGQQLGGDDCGPSDNPLGPGCGVSEGGPREAEPANGVHNGEHNDDDDRGQQRGQQPTSGREIYSNQFYYCRPKA